MEEVTREGESKGCEEGNIDKVREEEDTNLPKTFAFIDHFLNFRDRTTLTVVQDGCSQS